MATVAIEEAATQLSELVARAAAGEDVVIGQAGRPSVRLVPIDAVRPRRRFGSMAGQFQVDDRFSEPLPDEELRRWEGR